MNGLPPPKPIMLKERSSMLFLQYGELDVIDGAFVLVDKTGVRTHIPVGGIACLMLEPGTRISHAAVKLAAYVGCLLIWVGEGGVRMYAAGQPGGARADRLLYQARCALDDTARLKIVKKMYEIRFGERPPERRSIEQLRGMEGARMRTAYMRTSLKTGVAWHGRAYDRANWGNSDPINRALSAANALLNGLCQAAIVSGGYSPALGFIHTGKQRSFVFDIADLYKTEITIPVAFRVTAKGKERLGPRVREACRQAFKEAKLLQRILPDIEELLDVPPELLAAGREVDSDAARPEALWDPYQTVPISWETQWKVEHGGDDP